MKMLSGVVQHAICKKKKVLDKLKFAGFISGKKAKTVQ